MKRTALFLALTVCIGFSTAFTASAQYNEPGVMPAAPTPPAVRFPEPLAPGGMFPDGLIGLSSTSPGVLYTVDSGTGAAAPYVPLNGEASFTGLSYLSGTLYGTDLIGYPGGAGGFDIGSIDTDGTINFLSDQNGSSNWHGLASDEAADIMWSIDLNNSNQLTEQFLDGTVNVIGPSGIEGRGMAYDDGNGILYALGPASDAQSLYTVDRATGASTLIGPTGITSFYVGLAFDECSRTLYMTATQPGPANGPSFLYTLDTATGAATLVGPTGFSTIDGLAWKGECFKKELTSGPDADGDGAIDLVVEIGQLTPAAYDFTITWAGFEGVPVLIGDRAPAEWDVTEIEFDGTGLPLDCGGEATFVGPYGMVDVFRGGKPGKKCESDTGIEWMPATSQTLTHFYWTNGWTAGPLGGPFGTVNRVNADGSGAAVLANTAASGGPLYRVTDVEIDQARDALYFTNWHSGTSNNPDEAIYRTDLNGAGQIQFSSASSSATGASGLHRLAVDPANGDVYFARGVSYANPDEVSRVDVTGGGYTQLIGATDGWFYSGVALDDVNGLVYFGDGGFIWGVGVIDGSLNVMTKAGAAPAVLVPHGAGPPLFGMGGMGKTVAFDPNFGPMGTAFYSGWLINDIYQGPGDLGTTGEIYAYDVASGVSTLIYSDPAHGIPDIEVDTDTQRIYWTDYVRGEIRSANYDGSGPAVEVSGLLNPFGLALGFEVDNTLNVQLLARCHDNKKNQKCKPTSCGALYLNYGAAAYDKETGELLAGPTDPLCLAAVEDLNGGGLVLDGSGDEDGDFLSDLEEACEIGTDPCDADTDDDGIPDNRDECPLEGPADPALGEILDPNGCIRQSQCSDGDDNDGDGLIDFGADPQCDDILDDDESPKACVPSTCAAGFPQCDATDPNGCYCFATDPAITTGVCVDDFYCSGAEDCSADPTICEPLGKACYYDTCCGRAFCGPAMCTGQIQSAPITMDPAAPKASGL